MGEVGVHLQQQVGALGERAVEAGQVRGADPLLALAVQHLDLLDLGGEAVGDRAGAVGRVVVHHEDAVGQSRPTRDGAARRG